MRSLFKIVLIILASFSFVSYGQNDEKILELHKTINKAKHDTVLSQSYKALGNIFYYTNTDSALFYYQMTADLLPEIQKSKDGQSAPNLSWLTLAYEAAAAMRYSGLIYRNQGNTELAIKCAIDALKIFEELQNSELEYYLNKSKHGASACLLNLGTLHDSQGNLDRALEYYERAIIVKSEIGDNSGIAAAYVNIGLVYSSKASSNLKNDSLSQKDYFELSYEHYQKAIKIFESSNDLNNLTLCYNNVGALFIDQQEFDKALIYLRKSRVIAEELNIKEKLSYLYSMFTDAYYKMALSQNSNSRKMNLLLDSALYFGHKSYELAFEIGFLTIQKSTASTLKQIYTKIGDYNLALKYANIYIKAKDSLFDGEKTRAIAEVEAIYETEKKDIENEALKTTNELNVKTIQMQRLLVFLFAGALLFVSIMIWMMYRNRKKLKALNIKIQESQKKTESANRELKAKSEELEKFNAVMLDREMRIIELKNEVNKEAKENNKEEPYPETGDA